jgi:hypothetical protein
MSYEFWVLSLGLVRHALFEGQKYGLISQNVLAALNADCRIQVALLEEEARRNFLTGFTGFTGFLPPCQPHR